MCALQDNPHCVSHVEVLHLRHDTSIQNGPTVRKNVAATAAGEVLLTRGKFDIIDIIYNHFVRTHARRAVRAMSQALSTWQRTLRARDGLAHTVLLSWCLLRRQLLSRALHEWRRQLLSASYEGQLAGVSARARRCQMRWMLARMLHTTLVRV